MRVNNRPVRKRSLVKVALLLSFVAGALIWAGKASAESIGFSLHTSESPGMISVTVVDDLTGLPVPEAEVAVTDSINPVGVSVGYDEDQFGRTDDSGRIEFTLGDEIVLPKTVSVFKDGYAMLTVVGIVADQMTAFLKPVPDDRADIVGNGILGGWKGIPSGSSSTVYAGLVFKSLAPMDLIQFHPDSFISPMTDYVPEIDRNVPSNLVLPEQKVTVVIAPIRLNKPVYRLPLAPSRPFRLTGVHGEIKVRELIGGSGVTIETLNKVKFTRAGITPELVSDADFSQSFNAVTALSPAHRVTVNRPPFVADVLVAAVTDLNGDREVLIPTDIKSPVSKEKPAEIKTVTLSAPTVREQATSGVLSFAIANQGRRLSGIWTDEAGSVVAPGNFLPTEDLSAHQELPSTISVSAPHGGLGAVIFESHRRSAPIWMVYVLPKMGDVTVSTERLSSLPSGRLKGFAVARLEFGRSFNEDEIDGNRIMTRLHRFSRSSVGF